MDLASEQTMPIQNGRKETRQGHWYGDVMRVHEAAPKLIVQERVGESVKISSYCPVALLTRAGLTLGRLQTQRVCTLISYTKLQCLGWHSRRRTPLSLVSGRLHLA